MCDGYESRKKIQDGAWLNPKRFLIGDQQRSSEEENVRRSEHMLVGYKRLVAEVVGIRKDEDMTCSCMKVQVGCSESRNIKDLTGEYGDRDFIVARGDSRVSLTITKDEYSLRFDRNSRFIIDDYDSPEPLAYRITKPYKLGGSFDDTGVFRFVLTECNTEED